MSINIPEKYSKEEFNKLMNKTLKGNDFSQYQALFRESYKKPQKGATEYSDEFITSNYQRAMVRQRRSVRAMHAGRQADEGAVILDGAEPRRAR